MRVLILSANTGEGHNSCAKAIQEVYDNNNVHCDIEDVLSFVGPKFSRFISWGHSTMYKSLPCLFRYGYTFFERHPGNFDKNNWVYNVLSKASENLYNHIKENDYDTVICVHIFSSYILTDVLEKYELNIKSCFVATDYTCSPSAKNSNLDYYFIPDDSLADEFECDTIPKSKMVSSGIPIRQAFYEHCSKEEAKEQFGIDRNHPHLIMMCGSMGCGPMKRLVRLMSHENGFEMTVVCGSNEKLYRRLSKRHSSNQNIHIRGYERNMPLLMDSADLYLTKPGGLSTTEAYVKNLPMVCIDAVAGCEEYNCRYFMEKGVAKCGRSAKELRNQCIYLLEHPKEILEMQEKLSKMDKQNATETIYRFMASV